MSSPSIRWLIPYPGSAQKFYTQAAEIMVKEYRKRMPDAFDEPFELRFVEKLTLPTGGEASGAASLHEAECKIDPHPNIFTYRTDLQLISHELAHLFFARHAGGKNWMGKYQPPSPRVENDFVHLASNDAEGENQYRLITYKRMSGLVVLLALKLPLPWISLPIFEVAEMWKVRDYFVDIIRRGLAPAGRHQYFIQ